MSNNVVCDSHSFPCCLFACDMSLSACGEFVVPGLRWAAAAALTSTCMLLLCKLSVQLLTAYYRQGCWRSWQLHSACVLCFTIGLLPLQPTSCFLLASTIGQGWQIVTHELCIQPIGEISRCFIHRLSLFCGQTMIEPCLHIEKWDATHTDSMWHHAGKQIVYSFYSRPCTQVAM